MLYLHNLVLPTYCI